MPISVQCPNPACGKTSLAPDDALGRRMKCKRCGAGFFAAATMDGAKNDTFTPALPMRDPGVPQTVGRFEVRAKLGAGAFGTVYRAYDPQLDREVALKVPNAAVMDSPKRVERFLREAKASAGLRHPHIVPVFDAGKDGERYFIASAFIAGKKLADTFDEGGTDLRRAARLVRELAEALAYAHEQGVVHRDVKPDNIMVDAEDRVHLMDFGLASKLDVESKLTNDGAVLGTPSYMAPEQARGQEGEAKAAADQYSAGVVLYELMTGQVPFEGPPAIVIHSQIHNEPDRPTKHRKDIPRDLETVCLKALAKRPEERYRDCQALADDLRRWLDGEPIAARRLSSWEQAARWAGKNKTVAGLSAAVALSLVLGGVASAAFAVQAREQAGRADRAAAAAREAQGVAETNEKDAKAARAAAVDAARAARRGEYAAALNGLEHVWERGPGTQIRETLNGQRPRGDEPDLRGFEWHYWDRLMKSGLATYQGTPGTTCLAVSADGATAATFNRDGTVDVRELATGKVVQTVRGKAGGWIGGIALSADGKRVAVGRHDRTFTVHDVATGKEVRSLEQPDKVFGVAFSPDGRTAACAAGTSVRLWDLESGRLVHELKVGEDALTPVFSPDSSRVVVTGYAWAPTVFDARSGEKLLTLSGHQAGVLCAAFSPDGRRIATGGWEKVVRIWDAASGAGLHELRGHEGDVQGVGFDADGGRVVSGGTATTVRVWDVATGQAMHTFKGHTGSVAGVAFLPDGNRVVSAGTDGRVKLWDVKAGQPRWAEYRSRARTTGAAFSPDSRLVASALFGDRVLFFDSRTGKELRALTGHMSVVSAVAFFPDGKRMVTGSWDQAVRVWDVETRGLVRTIPGTGQKVFHVSLSPDGTRVVSGGFGDGGFLRCHDAETGQEVFGLRGVTSRGSAVSPDGQTLLWVGDRGTATLRMTDGTETASFGPGGQLCAAWHPEGGRFVTGGSDRLGHVWDARSNAPVGKLQGHTSEVRAVAYSPDGRRIATAGGDRTVRVWDAETFRLLLTLRGHTAGVVGLAFSADGHRIASAGDETVRVWDATPAPD